MIRAEKLLDLSMTTLYFPSSGNPVIKDFNPIPTKTSKFGQGVKRNNTSFHPFRQPPKSLDGSTIPSVDIQLQFLTLCSQNREWFYSFPFVLMQNLEIFQKTAQGC